jgi:hypothetical protein
MDTVQFLEAIAADSKEAIKTLAMPYKPDKGEPVGNRTPSVWKMRLKKSSAAQKIAPYIIHQVITTDDHQEQGREDVSSLCLRSIFCTYNEDEEEGSLALLNLITRVKTHWLKNRIVDGRFELDMAQGIQSLIYPDETNDFYSGEMVTYWKLPPVQREVIVDGYNYYNGRSIDE